MSNTPAPDNKKEDQLLRQIIPPYLIVRALEVLTLIIVLVGFASLFSLAIYLTWDYEVDQAPENLLEEVKDPDQDPGDEHINWVLTDTALYIATALSGFIMTFFANRMGIKIDPTNEVTQNAEEDPVKKALKGKLFGKLILKYLYDKDDEGRDNYLLTKKAIGAIYMIVYFVVAVAAIVTWAFKPEVTPNVVKNVASISVTMFISIAKGVLDTIEE